MNKILCDNLTEKVRRANIEVHHQEAGVYDYIHKEIFNAYEQQRVWTDIRFIMELVGKDSPTVLDIGCGTGNLTLKFSQLGCSVTGVDISTSMLKVLRTKESKIPLVCADVEQFFLMSSRRFEVISFSSVLHHFVNYSQVLKLCIERLHQEGVIYITHEPISGAGQTPGWQKLVGRITRLLRRKVLALRGQTLPDIDYSLSDFHAREGLDHQQLTKFLESEGCRIIKTKQYFSSRYPVWILLSNKFRSNANTFNLIVQRV